jgi:hypothetical protein
MLTFGSNMLLLALGWTFEGRRIGWLIPTWVSWKERSPLVSKEEEMEPGPHGEQEDGTFKVKLFFLIVGGKCKYERLCLLTGPRFCFYVSSTYALLPWRWRQHVSSKYWYPLVLLDINHASTQKTMCAVKNSKLRQCYGVSWQIFQFFGLINWISWYYIEIERGQVLTCL